MSGIKILKYALLNLVTLDTSNTANQNNHNQKKAEKLILMVTASFIGAVGYGNIYKCQISKVKSGNLGEKEITITILAGDTVNSTFFSTHTNTAEFEIGFNKRKTNEPYPLMPISGFVDKDKTSWEIEYVK